MEERGASQSASRAGGGRDESPDLSLFLAKHIYELGRDEAVDASLIEKVIKLAARRTQDPTRSAVYGSTILVLSPLEARILRIEDVKKVAFPFSFGIIVHAQKEEPTWRVLYVPAGTYSVDFSLARGTRSQNTIDHLVRPEQYLAKGQMIGTVPRLSTKGALESSQACFTPAMLHEQNVIPLRPFSFGGKRRHTSFD